MGRRLFDALFLAAKNLTSSTNRHKTRAAIDARGMCIYILHCIPALPCVMCGDNVGISIFSVGFCVARFWRLAVVRAFSSGTSSSTATHALFFVCGRITIFLNYLVLGMLQEQNKIFMKKFSLYSLLTVFALLTASNAYAYDLEVDGIYYNLDMTNYTATVTYGDNKYAGDVVVPSTIQYKTAKFDVVKIGGSAFERCSELTSVRIGEGVTAIGKEAFQYSKKLVKVTIPSTLRTIGSGAFYQCESLEEATLPEGVEEIEYSTFCNCYKLAEIIIPSTVKTIGSNAFDNCQSVKKLFIPKSVTYIDTSAFEDLTLDELIVEDGDGEISVFYWPFYGTSTKTLYIGRPIPLNANFKNNETQTLILGPKLNKWYNSYTGTGVTKVISKIENPSQLVPVFAPITYLDAELIVPNGTLELYKADENWKKFLSISEEGTGTGINSINAANAEGTQTFTVGGIRTSANSKGISIIRENGKTKKVLR